MIFDIKWVSTILLIIGGTSVALQTPWIKYAFPGFVLAHSILIYYFWKTHFNKPLLFQNVYFFIVNIVATFIWFSNKV
jgi:hypothetical protein